MRSLFLKIFIWFWLTIIVVGLTFALSAVILPTGSLISEWRKFAVNTIYLSGLTAVETYEKGGRSALWEYVTKLQVDTEIGIFLYDSQGTFLSGTNEPQSVRDVALRTFDSQGPVFDRFRKMPLVAKQLEGQSGQSYVIVSQIPGGPFSRLLMASRGQLLRLLAVVVVAGLICYWLAKYLTNPIKKLQSATREFANGNLRVRVGSQVGGRRDEIAELARDFDMMAHRIEALIHAQKHLTRDISHELRSPLTRLSVALELARDKAGEHATEALDRIEFEVNRLNKLIGQLLTLTRLETGTDVLEKVPVNLIDLMDGIVRDAQFEAQARNCSVKFSYHQQIVIEGERELLYSAIENVVRNGLRYTQEGTEVELSLTHLRLDSGDFVSVRVRDHGDGVDEDLLAKLFQPFYRVGEARERSTGGTGLGLAIAERAVTLHGGTITAANASGGGLIVEILLPLSQ